MSNFLTDIGIIGGADGPTAVLVSEGSDFMFNPMNFVDNLYYMGVGMLGIFVVIGLVWFTTFAINKIFSDKKKDGE